MLTSPRLSTVSSPKRQSTRKATGEARRDFNPTRRCPGRTESPRRWTPQLGPPRESLQAAARPTLAVRPLVITQRPASASRARSTSVPGRRDSPPRRLGSPQRYGAEVDRQTARQELRKALGAHWGQMSAEAIEKLVNWRLGWVSGGSGGGAGSLAVASSPPYAHKLEYTHEGALDESLGSPTHEVETVRIVEFEDMAFAPSESLTTIRSDFPGHDFEQYMEGADEPQLAPPEEALGFL